MKIKRYLDKDMRHVLRRVREDQGPDAVILSNRRVEDGIEVIACCRSPESARRLLELSADFPGRVSVRPLEVTNATQINALAAELKGQPIAALINNAGVYGPRSSEGPPPTAAWLDVLHVNTVAPFAVSEALLDSVQAADGGKIVNVTSKMGSIADNGSGGSYIYRSSKAALNAAMHSLAIDLKDRGVIVLLLHPGWVRTDMGGPSGLIEAPESVKGMRRVIGRATLDDSGGFFAYDGKPIPW